GNPDEPSIERVIGQMQGAARAKRVELRVLKPRTESEIDAAFVTLVQMQADGLVLGPIGFRSQIAALASLHAVPAIALQRDFADVGGLISYGPRLTDAYHLKGIYAGKILKGAKPADLPVQQPTKFELVIQPQDGQGARSHRAASAAGARRRRHRIKRCRRFDRARRGRPVSAPMARFH